MFFFQLKCQDWIQTATSHKLLITEQQINKILMNVIQYKQSWHSLGLKVKYVKISQMQPIICL